MKWYVFIKYKIIFIKNDTLPLLIDMLQTSQNLHLSLNKWSAFTVKCF